MKNCTLGVKQPSPTHLIRANFSFWLTANYFVFYVLSSVFYVLSSVFYVLSSVFQ